MTPGTIPGEHEGPGDAQGDESMPIMALWSRGKVFAMRLLVLIAAPGWPSMVKLMDKTGQPALLGKHIGCLPLSKEDPH